MQTSTTNPERCPLCGHKVMYRGLNSLECDGIGCENFKLPPELEKIKQEIQFDDTLIDWPWFMGLCDWLARVSGLVIFPEQLDNSTFMINVPGMPDLPFVVRTTYPRSDVKKFLRNSSWFSFLPLKSLKQVMT